MERIFELVALLLFWRTALITAISVVLAISLAAIVPAFTGVAGIVLVCVGFGVGLLWEGAANPEQAQTAPTPTQDISWPVAVLALAFFGALVGGLVSAITGSTLVGGAILLSGVAVLGFHRAQVVKRPVPFRSLAISTISLMVGFGLLVTLGALHEQPTSSPSVNTGAAR